MVFSKIDNNIVDVASKLNCDNITTITITHHKHRYISVVSSLRLY